MRGPSCVCIARGKLAALAAARPHLPCKMIPARKSVEWCAPPGRNLMLDIAKKVLLVAPAALLVGCGVLGVATKGDLEKQSAALDLRDQKRVAEVQALQGELESVGRELAEMERAFAPRLKSVEEEVAALEGVRVRLDGLARRLEDAKQQLTIVEGKTRQELERLDESVSVAVSGAAEARELALTADERGRLVSSAYADGLRAERRRLQRELEEIEEQLDAFAVAAVESHAVLRERENPAPR